jgi:nitrogen regulatory protein PII
MTSLMRVEIIVDVVQLDVVTQIIDDAGVGGYTVIPVALGKGHRGIRAGDQIADVMKNVMVLVACSEDQSKLIALKLKSLLKRFGGLCLISPTQSVDH